MAVSTDDKKLDGFGLSVLWGLIVDLFNSIFVPTKTSDLTNDSDFVSDANYVHTDNNYTTTEKNKLGNVEAGAEVNVINDVKVNNVSVVVSNKSVNIPVPTDNSQIGNSAGYQTAADVNTLIDAKMKATMIPKGSLAFANLPTPSSSNLGWMWDMTDEFTIDNRFLHYDAQDPQTFGVGTNVFVVEATPESGSTPATYKFDTYVGKIDLSGYATKDDVEVLSQAEIQSICTLSPASSE